MTSSSPLNIEQYFVNELHIKANPEYVQSEQGQAGKLTASLDIRRKGGDPEFMIVIEIEANKSEADFKVNPYYIFLNIAGFFSFTQGSGEEIIQRMIALNGPAILYGIARGIVAQATAGSLHDKYVLPTVNFVEVAKRNIEKEELIKPRARKKK